MAGGGLDADAQLLGDKVGQAGLAQPGRAVEEDMVEVLAPLAGGLDEDLKVGLDLVLADELVERPRPEAVLEEDVLLGANGAEDGRHRSGSMILYSTSASGQARSLGLF